jgi:hypothetical protein
VDELFATNDWSVEKSRDALAVIDIEHQIGAQ